MTTLEGQAFEAWWGRQRYKGPHGADAVKHLARAAFEAGQKEATERVGKVAVQAIINEGVYRRALETISDHKEHMVYPLNDSATLRAVLAIAREALKGGKE